MLLLKSAQVFAPNYLGVKDILICGGKIVYINDNITLSSLPFEAKVIDAAGLIATPGFIDSHIHFNGAGGEGSPVYRTDPLTIDDITQAGITTAVGLLGTDGYTRSLLGLLQKAYALEIEGINTYIYVGSYQTPVKTITGSIATDIIAIPKVLGVGEIAIADHRSSWPTCNELIKIASEVRVSAMLSGKKGIVHLHTGNFANPVMLIEEIVKTTNIPAWHFLPTHLNRDKKVLEYAIKYAKNFNGYVDLTAVTKDLRASDAVALMSKEGVNISQISISSDGGGSLPKFDKNGNLLKMDVAKPKTLLEEFLLLKEQIEIEKALMPFSINPAKILGLKDKGQISIGKDADILLFDDSFRLRTVICKGNTLKKMS